jgi:hypothetical protein
LEREGLLSRQGRRFIVRGDTRIAVGTERRSAGEPRESRGLWSLG